MGRAYGKRLYGYLDDFRSMVDKLRTGYGIIITDDNRVVDKDGLAIEEFDLPLNLMLSVPVRLVQGGFEDCVKLVRRDIDSFGLVI